jgi:hypothetical protein
VIKEVLLLHHSHFDYGYTHPQAAIAVLAARAIDQALDLADATATLPPGDRFCWTCETTAALTFWLERASTARRAQLRRVAARGQFSCGALEFHGTPLLGPDEYRRQLQGMSRLRDQFGLACRVAVQNDVNGIAWPAVGLLREAGVDLLMMGMNLTMGALAFGRRHVLFRWQGPDGRELLAFHGDHYNAFGRLFRLTAPGDRLDGSRWAAYENTLREVWGWKQDWVCLTVSMNRFPDNNPPDPHLTRVIEEWNRRGSGPRVRLVSLEEVSDRMHAVPKEAIVSYSGEWSDYWAFGVGSSARETSVNRRARARLKATAALGVATRSPHSPVLEQAQHACLWWDEHSWGSYHATEGEANDTVAVQWQEKAAFAWRAAGLGELAIRDELERLADNAATGTRPEGILLYNPSPTPAAWARPVFHRLVTGEYVHSQARATALDAMLLTSRGTETDLPGTMSWVKGAPLPPFSWRFVPIREALDAPTVDMESGDGWIAHHWLTVRFDPASGQVSQVSDRESGADLLALGSPFALGQPVHEIPAGILPPAAPPMAGRDAFWTMDYDRIHDNESTWRRDWIAETQGATAVHGEVIREPGRITLRTSWQGPGMIRAVTRLTLHAHRPGIDLELELEKADQKLPEATYLAFPVRIRQGWTGYADIAETPYELDREQLPGVCRDFVAASGWVAIADEAGCVQLCCPDAPLVMLNGGNFGRIHESVPRDADPVLLAWPLNNYWYTNFRASQPGVSRIRYQLFFDRGYDPGVCVRRGQAAAHEVEIHPVLRLPAEAAREGALCATSGDLVVLRLDGSSRRVMVTLLNPRSERSSGTFRLTAGPWGDPIPVDVLDRPLTDPAIELHPVADGHLISVTGRRLVRLRFAVPGDAPGATNAEP